MYIDLPANMYKDSTCAHTSTVDPNCLHQCSDSPWEYQGWEDPFAWAIAEMGQSFTDTTLDALEYIPFIQSDKLRENANIKLAILRINDADTLTVHRICAITSAYLLVPYLMLGMLIFLGGIGSIVIATRLLLPLVNLWNSIIIAASS